MSLPIWTPDALSSSARPYAGQGWRVVEAQHWVSTLKLVDSVDEQNLLEDILEETKPLLPVECTGLDYLLATPFRYGAIYPYGSRFRRAGKTLGVFYAAEQVETAVAELAFYRLLFFVESPDTRPPANAADYTAFAVSLSVDAAIDLMAPPVNADAIAWTHPTDYAACQSLADAARNAGALIIRYQSVRDPQQRANLAVLSCRAFAAPAPVARQTWKMRISQNGVQALCDFPRQAIEFTRADFAADPRISAA